MHHPADIVLNALLRGQRVAIGGITYVWENGHLWMPGEHHVVGKPVAEILLSVEHSLSLGQFIRLCETMPRDEVALIATGIALTEMGREGARDREIWRAEYQNDFGPSERPRG